MGLFWQLWTRFSAFSFDFGEAVPGPPDLRPFRVVPEQAWTGDRNGTSLKTHQAELLKTGERPGDDVSDRSNSRCNLVVGEAEAEVDGATRLHAGSFGLGEKQQRKPLADLMQGQDVDQLGVSAHSLRHQP